MEVLTLGTVLAIAGVVTTLGTAYLTIRKIQSDSAKERDKERATILQEAKEEDAKVRKDLEGQIEALKAELKNLKENSEKDLEHLRETYNGEIRFLGQKIEELRSEVRNQHGQLVQLLTKMIEKSD